MKEKQETPVEVERRNEVRLRGRLTGAGEERTLPSGDVIVTFRVCVDRGVSREGVRRQVDALECVAWQPRVRRSVMSWRVDQQVEVEGELRRRFFRSGVGPASRVEVEVLRARRVRP